MKEEKQKRYAPLAIHVEVKADQHGIHVHGAAIPWEWIDVARRLWRGSAVPWTPEKKFWHGLARAIESAEYYLKKEPTHIIRDIEHGFEISFPRNNLKIAWDETTQEICGHVKTVTQEEWDKSTSHLFWGKGPTDHTGEVVGEWIPIPRPSDTGIHPTGETFPDLPKP